MGFRLEALCVFWLRGKDLNLRPSGYEPDELPDCSTPRQLLESKIIHEVDASCVPAGRGHSPGKLGVTVGGRLTRWAVYLVQTDRRATC